jgi:hypothetical protein
MANIEFSVNNEIKQEYLQSKPTGTADSDAFVLREFDNYENQVGKQVYNLSIPELNEMFATLRNTSKRGAGKNKSILVNYIDFCVSKKIVSHMENRARYIDINDFVHRQALLSKYIPREKMIQYQNTLFNYQDQLILWLPYIGVRGRTIDDGTMEEVINLTIDDINEKENILILRQNDGVSRILDNVPNFIFDVIREAYEQEYYIENNGEMTNNPKIPDPRKSIINKTGKSKTDELINRYVLRKPGKNKFEIFTPSLLNSRMRKIQEACDNRYLTYSSIYFSGMLQMCFDIYKEKGEITDRDFDDVCVRYNYGVKENTSNKESSYWYVIKDMFYQYKELLRV